MRGAILFLAAVALAAAAAVLVILPGIRHRDELRRDVATAAAEPEDASPLDEVRPTLARAAAPVDPDGLSRRFAAIAKEYAPATGLPESGDTVLVLAWDRLPAFLHSLAEVAGILETVRVDPAADAGRCRVTVVRAEEPR